MFRNQAGQKVTLLAIDTATNLPKTGDAANLFAYVSKDDGGVTVLADTTATEKDATNAPGLYDFDVAQAETNADKTVWSGKSTTSGVRLVPVTIYTLNLQSLGIKHRGTLQSASSTSVFRLATSASSDNDAYNGNQANPISGTGSDQSPRSVVGYVGADREVTVSPAFDQILDGTTVVDIQAEAPAPAGAFATTVNVGTIYGYSAENFRKMLDGTGGVSLTAEFIGNQTGNLSGSVGSTISLHVDAIAATVAAIFARVFHATKMSGLTFEEITAIVACAEVAKVSGLPTAPVFRNRGDTENAISATTDGTNGNRSSVTLNLTAVR